MNMTDNQRAVVQRHRGRVLRQLLNADAVLGENLNPSCLELIAKLMDVVAHVELTPALGELMTDMHAVYGGILDAAADEAERVSKTRPVWASANAEPIVCRRCWQPVDGTLDGFCTACLNGPPTPHDGYMVGG